jgi:hypothetical protein
MTRFPAFPPCGIAYPMKLAAWIRTLLAMLAVLGYVVTSGVASTSAVAASTIVTSTMAVEMPCCTPDQPAGSGCHKECPQPPDCALKCPFSAPLLLPAAGSQIVTVAIVAMARIEPLPTGFNPQPPAAPPRT